MPKFFKFNVTSVCSVAMLQYLLCDWWTNESLVYFGKSDVSFIYLMPNNTNNRKCILRQATSKNTKSNSRLHVFNANVCLRITSRSFCKKMHSMRTFFGSKCDLVLRNWCALVRFLCIFGCFWWCPHFHITY